MIPKLFKFIIFIFLIITCDSLFITSLLKVKLNAMKILLSILPLSLTISASKPFRIEDKCGFKYETVNIIGEGGSGTVYLARGSSANFNSNDNTYVMKISHGNPRGVQNECKILKHFHSSLYKKRYENGVEKCLCEVNNIQNPSRSSSQGGEVKNKESGIDTAIVMKPYFENPTSTFESLKSAQIREQAVTRFVDIVADLLMTGIVSTDLQPLIDPKTGDVLLVDFSEAKLIPISGSELNFIDKLSIQAFLSEALSTIPGDPKTQHLARQQLLQRMNERELGEEGKFASGIYKNLLEDD